MGALLPIMSAVLIAFLVIGFAMPILPLHVHQGLGLGTFVVGLVAGSQFAASLVSRPWAGHYADSRGAKRAVVAGLIAASGAGMLYLLSLRFASAPMVSVTILLLGRALLGGAESFIITGALSWGLGLVSSQYTGKVIAWMGTAMFAAFAVGAPAGTSLYARYGFAAIAVATTVMPLLTLWIVAPLKSVTPSGAARVQLGHVLNAIWVPGIGLAFASVGFGAITAFVALLFAARGWSPVWPPFTGFAVAFIFARVLFGHLADKRGGAKVALAFVLLEVAGQALIWLAPRYTLALVGAVLTGFGYSLVYPAFGVEAVRRVSPQSRGLAMGAYTAFLDLALGIASPALGLVAGAWGMGSVFLVSALLVLCAAGIAMFLLSQPRGLSAYNNA
ncbi:arabinose transporter [Rhodoferax sediminis]|uniref:arabinose transporter n=1 Tax=Rhodoferax sediminis TaxID=2509614 RepID=UPI001FCE8195|nr:arabinose transporter [Rhodoferax sediminis]